MMWRLITGLLVLVSALSAMPGSATAETVLNNIEFSSSPNPVGSGARAMGVGNAFIAIADDATAASWNPAGLYQLEKPEFSVVGAYMLRSEKYSSSQHPEFDSTQSVDETNFNYISAAYPFTFLQRNMIVSLNYQKLFELDKDLDLDLNGAADFATQLGISEVEGKFNVEQEGGLRTISPAYAIQITPQIAFGFTLNFWTQIGSTVNGWHQVQTASLTAIDTDTGGVFSSTSIREDKFENFNGFNANLGILIDLPPNWIVGAVLKTPFTATADHDYRYIGSFTDSENPEGGNISANEGSESVDIHFPTRFGIGVSYRASDALTIAADVFRTEWNQYYIKQRHPASPDERVKVSPVSGLPTSETDTIQATHQVHLGVEYLIIGTSTVIPIRGGLMYDPEPRDGGTQNIYGLTLGSGVSIENISNYIGDVIVDVAWQLRFAQGIGGSVYGVDGSEMDLLQNKVLLSAIYHF